MRVIRALAQAGEDTLEESILSNLFAEELHAPHLFLTSDIGRRQYGCWQS